jgi:HNH endonuclease
MRAGRTATADSVGIKRAVRQRCGFGCVICGNPIYEYEHMVPYAQVREHTLDNITLLCDGHHRIKTGGLLPLEVVERANADPFNLRGSQSSPFYLHFGSSQASMLVGSVETRAFGHEAAAVMIAAIRLSGFGSRTVSAFCS